MPGVRSTGAVEVVFGWGHAGATPGGPGVENPPEAASGVLKVDNSSGTEKLVVAGPWVGCRGVGPHRCRSVPGACLLATDGSV